MDGVNSRLVGLLDGRLDSSRQRSLSRRSLSLHLDVSSSSGSSLGRRSDAKSGLNGCKSPERRMGRRMSARPARAKEAREGRQRQNALSSLIPLLHQPSDDPQARVLPVERMSELLTRRLVLLLERKRLEHERVPFGLERVEEGRDGSGGGRSGGGHIGRFEDGWNTPESQLSTPCLGREGR